MTISFADPTPLSHNQLEEGTTFTPRFDAAGLQSAFTPLYGNTPFNNWRVVASKPA